MMKSGWAITTEAPDGSTVYLAFKGWTVDMNEVIGFSSKGAALVAMRYIETNESCKCAVEYVSL